MSKAFLGLDIGSTTVKVVLVDERANHLAAPVCIRSMGRPLEVLRDALQHVTGNFSGNVAVGITGSGRDTVREALGVSQDCVVTEIYAHASGAWHVFPGVRTIVDIGGQDSKLIRLRADADGGFVVADFVMNDLCAAGTGAFLEMHAVDLGYGSIEEFGKSAAGSHPARIAGRCAVLAHSDIVHLRQSGESRDNMSAGLCRAVVINVLAMAGGKPLETPALFQGGVASNAGVVEALRNELDFDRGELVVPLNHTTLGALGAALHALKHRSVPCLTLEQITGTLTTPPVSIRQSSASDLQPLRATRKDTFGYPMSAPISTNTRRSDVVLGFDVGSASVKITALDLEGHCVFTYYKLHDGHPTDVLYEGLKELNRCLAHATPKAVAVTGSGRDMVDLKVGADINIDEITAQGAGARRLDPDVEAIFEIGGQDSKFIKLNNGQVQDFEMNRICAAGTGAFVMEAAKVLGVSAGRPLDEQACESERPAALSSRCCVFAKSDMVSLLNSGTARCDVAAGVVYAVVKNYLTLVVGNRDVGKRAIFLGGLAKNSKAVAAAFRQLRPEITVTVPDGCEISGALGAASIVLQELKAGHISATRFRGSAKTSVNKPAQEFTCGHCSNECGVSKWKTLDGQSQFTGGICGRYEDMGNGEKHGRNFTAEYLDILAGYEHQDRHGTVHGERVIGIPRALLYYEQGPVWLTFWQALGYRVVLSEPGKEVLKRGNLHSPSVEVCLPIKALIGHVAQLKAKGITKVFFPTLVETKRVPGASRSDSCMLIQGTMDAFLKTAFPELEFVTAVFRYEGRRYMWREALLEAGAGLGLSAEIVEQAADQAERVQEDFTRQKRSLGREFLQVAGGGAPCVALLGRAYSYSPELDMGISRHLARLGNNVAPLALLPIDEEERLGRDHFDLVFKSSQDMVLAAQFIRKQKSNVFPVVLNQFLCRQDTSVIPFANQIVSGRPHLHLTLDENAGEVGFRTRCSAFRHVMLHHMAAEKKEKEMMQPFIAFVPDKRYRRHKGTVWVTGNVRFYCAAFNSIGMRTKLLPHADPELIERGRKYFSNGEPCLPFIQLAGSLEKLKENGEFDPERDYLHIPGTRHCASTTLPHLMRSVCRELGFKDVRILSPREGFDITEAGDIFGLTFLQNLVRGLIGEEYLKKLHLSIRPYEVNAGETDTVFRSCLDDFYASFQKPRTFFRTLKGLIAGLMAVPTKNRGSRPKILVTGEYVVRTDSFLNQDIRRKVEDMGGEALRTPLFADYVELVANLRHIAFWKQGKHAKSLRESFLGWFCRRDIRNIRRLFEPHIPGQIEPNPVGYLEKIGTYVCGKLDPGILMEFYQTLWNMERGDVAGIINVHPFGCSISSAVEPLLDRHFAAQVPILKLSFDGQAHVHHDNRLAAFMESLTARERVVSSDLPREKDQWVGRVDLDFMKKVAAIVASLFLRGG